MRCTRNERISRPAVKECLGDVSLTEKSTQRDRVANPYVVDESALCRLAASFAQARGADCRVEFEVLRNRPLHAPGTQLIHGSRGSFKPERPACNSRKATLRAHARVRFQAQRTLVRPDSTLW
jgi:hypothetical protein